jgi:N12 class adenine-specific DNA methylase
MITSLPAPCETSIGAAWDTLAEALPAEEGDGVLSINRYFLDHPEMVLGHHARTSSPYGPIYTCIPDPAVTLEDRLSVVLEHLPHRIHTLPDARALTKLHPTPSLQIGTAAEGATIKEGSYITVENELMQIVDGMTQPAQVRQGKGTVGIPAKHARIIRALIPIRDAVRAVLRAQESNQPWGPAQIRLRAAYNAFQRNFGPINLTTISENRSGHRRNPGNPSPAQSAAVP